MRRFIWREHKHTFRKAWRFCHENGQLIFLIMIICVGAVLGTISYHRLSSDNRTLFSFLITDQQAPATLVNGCLSVISAAFYGWVLLIVLFLLGLTVYGCPLIVMIVLFFGFCFGISECQSYESFGLWCMFKDVVIPSSAVGIAIITATKQALKMSCSFSRQLFPNHAHCGGLWHDFKSYLLYFIVCVFIVLIGSVVAVLLRLI